MASKQFHKSIRLLVIVLLIIGVIATTMMKNQFDLFDYAVALALIYIIWRTPLEYAK
jgi:cytochrome b561